MGLLGLVLVASLSTGCYQTGFHVGKCDDVTGPVGCGAADSSEKGAPADGQSEPTSNNAPAPAAPSAGQPQSAAQPAAAPADGQSEPTSNNAPAPAAPSAGQPQSAAQPAAAAASGANANDDRG